MRPVKLVLRNGDKGFQCFRQPAIARTPSGGLILACEAHAICPRDATQEAPAAIVVLTSSDNGLTWSEPQVVRTTEDAADKARVCPSFVINWVTGRVFLMTGFFFTMGEDGELAESGDTLHMELSYSDDSGLTWKHRDITTEIKGSKHWKTHSTISGHGIQLTQGAWTGRLIQPILIEDEEGEVRFVAVCSDDQGTMWWAGEPVGQGALDCAIIEKSDGSLLMKSRVKALECVSVHSYDGGRNWVGEEACFAYAPRGCTAMIERAFPTAPANSDQARVMFHPMLGFDNDDDTVGYGLLLVSIDDMQSWAGSAKFDTHELRDPDVASIPDQRIVVVTFGTSEGIGVSLISYDDLGLKDLAMGWQNTVEKQEEALAAAGLANEHDDFLEVNDMETHLRQIIARHERMHEEGHEHGDSC